MARWLLALGALQAAGAWPARAEAPLCPQYTPKRCELLGHGHNEYTYAVDGLNLLLEFTDGDYFTLRCPENLTLDNPALPRFEPQLRVNKVLSNCPALNVSYATALRALNVLVLDKLKLVNAGNVTHDQLANLSTVRTLELVNVQLAPGSLAALPGLRRLFLDGVRLPPGELHQLPRKLQMLGLTRMNTDVPADVLDALPSLVNVSVRDFHNVSVALGRHVQVLALQLPAVQVPYALPPELRSLAVFGWHDLRPERLAACALHSLSVLDVTAEELPEDWVRACAELRVLRVKNGPQLRTLHKGMLRGATWLRELRVTRCALTSLPTGLLDDAGNLTVLDLTGNLLQWTVGSNWVPADAGAGAQYAVDERVLVAEGGDVAPPARPQLQRAGRLVRQRAGHRARSITIGKIKQVDLSQPEEHQYRSDLSRLARIHASAGEARPVCEQLHLRHVRRPAVLWLQGREGDPHEEQRDPAAIHAGRLREDAEGRDVARRRDARRRARVRLTAPPTGRRARCASDPATCASPRSARAVRCATCRSTRSRAPSRRCRATPATGGCTSRTTTSPSSTSPSPTSPHIYRFVFQYALRDARPRHVVVLLDVTLSNW